MKFKLKVDGKVKYSNGEQAAFKALSEKPKSSTAILEKVYPDGKGDMPYNGRKILIGTLKSLKRKLLTNKEPFKLCNSERNGPHAMEFWLEAK